MCDLGVVGKDEEEISFGDRRDGNVRSPVEEHYFCSEVQRSNQLLGESEVDSSRTPDMPSPRI
jgi:hypothetical protein